ncbi:MAG: transglycosylase domain-containing protein [Spirochaetaceae bacterium]|nr:transglycosylase domain-containing protein [Spirochaetaceae bacterium]
MSSTKKRILFSLIGMTGVLFFILRFSPFKGLEEFERSHYSIPIYSSQKKRLALLPLENGLRREFLSIDDLEEDYRQIILDSEDKRFFFHPGFDLFSLIRASWQYMVSREINSGASTVTMQLSRMIYPRVKGVRGKVFEIFNAMRLEARYSKKEILEAYINHLPFGSNLEGIKSAAYYFFGKDVKDLSREELLILMMIPRRPEDYNPLENPLANREAVDRTLERIRQDLSTDGLDSAFESLANRKPQWTMLYPHFIQMIRSGLTDLQWRQGKPLYTSLDEEFQQGAQSYLETILEMTGENRISNGAVLAINNETGQILAYIGSVDFYSRQEGQNDGVRILRQPGSTLKPFLYGKAIESGFSPSTPLPDIPLEFGHREVYIPENYNEQYNGPVRLSVALGSSLNVPAVYLLERLGVKPFMEKLLHAGFTSLRNKEHLGVGLALGNGEVSLWELVQGFSLFSRGGKYIPLVYELQSETPQGLSVYPPAVSEMIRGILSNNKNRILGFGRINPLDVDFDACFKTGTSNQFNNIWALGSSQDITVGVWMGNFSGETVIGSPGSSYPARIVVSLLNDFHQEERFTSYGDFQKREICSLSGMLAGPRCPYTLEEKYPREVKMEPCVWHREIGIFLPPEYSRWISIYHQDYGIDSSHSSLEIVQPKDGSLYFLDPTLPDDSQEIAIRINGRNRVSLYINDTLVLEGEPPMTYFHKVEKGLFSIRAEKGGDSVKSEILIK